MTEHEHDWQIYYSGEGMGLYECKICKAKGYSHWLDTDGKIEEKDGLHSNDS